MSFKYFAYGGLAGTYLLALTPLIQNLFEPNPYSDVNRLYVNWGDYHVDLTYSFTKNSGCNLITFHVEGSSAGVFIPLDHVDLDGLPENFDRPPGEHVLNIRVLTDGRYVEKIRVHTRHDCEGTPVNKVFTTANNPNG